MNVIWSWIPERRNTALRYAVYAISCLSLFFASTSGNCQSIDTSRVSHERDAYGLKYREVQRAILVFTQGKHDAAKEILAAARLKHTETAADQCHDG